MSSYGARQRRRSSIRGRAVPQTVSQLTGGLPSSSFFAPSKPAIGAQAQTPGEEETQTVDPALSSAARPSTPSAPANSSPSPSAQAATPASLPSSSSNPINKLPTPPAANASAPLPSTAPRANASSDPAPHLTTTASNSMVLAGSVLPKNSPLSSPQLSTSPQPSSTAQPTRDFSSAPLVRNTLPPKLIEAIVVVALAVALILGGIFFYCFKLKRRERRLQESSQEDPNDDATLGATTCSSSHGVIGLNWPIDKKTIKVKKKTDSIITFGPGPEPNCAATLNDDDLLYNSPLRNEKYDFSDHTFFTSRTIPYGHSKDTNPYYGTGDDISHIPISYECKPIVGRSGRPITPLPPPPPLSLPRPPPAPTRPSDNTTTMRHLTIKKTSPSRRFNRVSKAARKLVPARLVTGVGIGKRRSDLRFPAQY
ncbi:hypothetical protein VP01_1606g5 [Puccinia sorghi]|uniref:Uncharacterized protein n=1 Tax=Puccinia sorghi TaxID=27349 RepID=A0A0L6VHD3_9BASI|nr:hypothetical protein VP01_1606g5 [Puccinia sorghi]